MKQKTGRKLLSFLLTLAMVVGLMPGMSLTAQAAEATTLTAETTTWENGDYVVPAEGVTISGHITVNGTVNLTLTEGATLTANTGITLGDNAKLNVSGEGEMVVNGSNGNANSTIAGTGKLVLKSGTLTATGGNGQSFSSGVEQTGNTGGVAINGTVIVNSGTLVATGGNGGSLNAHTIVKLKGGTGGVAIGGAVTINGGTVTATGGNGGSITITNYGDSNKGGNGGAAIGGAVTINGGTLTATKGDNGTLNIKNGSSNYAGTGSAGYDGTLTLGANVKLYEGTDNTGTVLDDNDSDSRVYFSEKKANMYAYGPDFAPETDKNALNNAITAAEIMYVGIKNNTDNTDVASALKTAIDIAKEVADNDKADQDAVDAATADITTAITAAEASLPMTNAETTWEEGTYFVPMYGATIADHITVNGTVNLILAKGATLTANAGITLSDGATLNVSGNGTMVVNGTSGNTNSTVAGSGVLVLKSGTLTANGGNGGNIAADGYHATANAGGAAINGNVIVNGGTLTATGGTGGSIGDYAISCTSGAGGIAVNGNVTVNSGTLTATDGASGTGGRTSRCTFGAGGTGYSGTLTLGKNIKLYEGTEASDEKLLDGDDSSSRVYEGAKKSKMYAQGPDKSELNDVIITAQILYFGIEENTDYTNIASTLKTAIDNAKAVADNDEADQDAVDAAVTALDNAQKEANDTKAVVDEIKALPESTALTTENYNTYKDAINKADTDFNELSTVAQGNVTEALKSKLAALKEAVDKEEADAEAAKEVSDKIADLPAKDQITKEDKAAIDAAKAAFGALTDDQKAKVSEADKKKLNDAVDTLAAIEKVMSEVSAKTGSDMVYNGNPIQLINTPTTALPEGYKIVYAVTTENTAPAENLYTTSIPTATDAGTYYVWYKVVGDENHTYTEAACITVMVAKKAVTVTAADQTVKLNEGIDTTVSKATLTGAVEGAVLTAATLTSGSTEAVTTQGTITVGAAVIKTADGEEDVTANYEITYRNGTLTVEKVPVTITTQPVANNRSYDGTTQPLLSNAGAADGGMIVYVLGDNAQTAPTEGYSMTIPTAVDSGTYYVWCDVAEDGNHEAIGPFCITVEIAVNGILGDVNGDGVADIADALMISRYDAELTTLNKNQLALGDITGDGNVDIADALYIARLDAGLLDE